MPRPSKTTDEILQLLELATVRFSFLTAPNRPTLDIRIRQAIDIYPELEELLQPALDELSAAAERELTARAAVNAAKSLIKSHLNK